jgi:glyoxylase-like metal-dependent hydrolase (beta-lactamase superfamily II)
MTTFRIGGLDIKAVSDGKLKTSLDNLVGLDRARGEELAGPTDDGTFFIAVNCFVIAREGRVILIDAGAGASMQPTLGGLPENLRTAGIDPSVVTHVVLTHIHPDHAKGLGDESGAPHYPNAEIVVHEDEAAFWLAPARGSEPPNVARNRTRAAINLAPYRERLRSVRNDELYLGLTAILAPGHTPGHTCWRVESNGEALLAWGDLVHFAAIQIPHPDAAVSYDLDKERARITRRRILDMVATERLAIAGAHVAAPGLGHVVRRNKGFAFEPAGRSALARAP